MMQRNAYLTKYRQPRSKVSLELQSKRTFVSGARRPRVLLIGDTRTVGHQGSALVVQVIFHEFERRGVDVISPRVVGSRFDLAKLASFDAVVINGEGALHVRSPKAHLISRVARRARDLGTPCFVLNSVIDECDDEVIEGFPALTAVFCRERRSLDRARSYGATAKLCPDVTLAVDMPANLKWTPGEKIIVTDSTLNSANRILHAFARRTHAPFLPMRTRPQVRMFSSKKSFLRVMKYEVRHKIGKMVPGSFTADRFGCAVESPDAFLRAIASGTKFIVSGRFHGVCLAMRLGVPFLAARTITHKVEGLLEDAQLSHKLVDMDAVNSTTRLDTLFAAGAWSEADEIHRRDYVASAEKAVAACFDEVVAHISAKRPQQ